VLIFTIYRRYKEILGGVFGLRLTKANINTSQAVLGVAKPVLTVVQWLKCAKPSKRDPHCATRIA
jgi:hypothetical protein